ncbi:glycosyltransferase family 92 protein At1g27200 [Pyrus x bretschneideri]|uniref:glycosyltransferase family 92 protein At1g27200 n=1 Tax=Pyrus x bretschneideri TaxID=225117 RepID=UPI00202DE993|nr:glycosyltransferase family 92 protein At1g27200 [Pyrus x bretschneideri]
MTIQIKQLFQLSSSPPPPPPLPSLNSRPPSFLSLFVCFQEAMRRTLPAFLLFTCASLFLLAFFSLHLSRTTDLIHHFPITLADDRHHSIAIRDQPLPTPHRTRHDVSSLTNSSSTAISTVSVLLPSWEILLIVSPETPLPSAGGNTYVCLFQNNDTSDARLSKPLPFTNRTTLACPMPNRVKRLRPFYQPVLAKCSDKDTLAPGSNSPELMVRWNFMVYESFSTEDDVVLFAKGLNNRQGVNRPPTEFRCVFGDINNKNAVRTAVTSSVQEVFRCHHPNLTDVNFNEKLIKISLEIVDANVVVPSVAYYSCRLPMETTTSAGASEIATTVGTTEIQQNNLDEVCVCTMVYNVAKFLREWVIYHSKVGVDRFILYDNDSDDGLESVVKELNDEGYNVSTLFWVWPKTQEAGFSHGVLYARRACKWVAYIDVDEFVFAPNLWAQSDQPSKHMLKSLLPENNHNNSVVGQVSIKCNDFGPSNQKNHPAEGVTQGYTCRRRFEQRHKSIVRLDAVDDSLVNVIHHFKLKKGYRTRQLSMEKAVVNHYKYQAWPEFQTKFRRRVSAYVVDWMQALNPQSKDRTPGLGFQPVEPKGWAEKFCEVRDERLKMLTQRWFGSHTPDGYRMVWQS